MGLGGGWGRRAYGDLGAGRDGEPALGGELGAEDLRRAGDEAHAEGRVREHLHAELALRVELELPRRLHGRGRGRGSAGGGHRGGSGERARVWCRRDWCSSEGTAGTRRSLAGVNGIGSVLKSLEEWNQRILTSSSSSEEKDQGI